MVGKNKIYWIYLFILLTLFSENFSELIRIKEQDRFPYTCYNYEECSNTYYIDLTYYKYRYIDLSIDFSTTGNNFDHNYLYYDYSNYLNEEIKFPREYYRTYTYYNYEDNTMHGSFILENIYVDTNYIIFYRSPIGDNFPISIYYSYNIYKDKYDENEKEDYSKSSSKSVKIFLRLIIIIVAVIILLGICFCLKRICPCGSKSSSLFFSIN